MQYEESLSNLDSQANGLEKKQLAERAVDIAQKQIMASTEFKKPRITRLNRYWELYDGKVTKKLRQLFNVNLPVFPGMVDTLNAMYDTPIQLKYKPGDPSDYFKVQKIQASWDNEILDSAQNSKWDSKFRIGRKHKIINGREIYRYSATSDPKYESTLDVVGLDNFTFQPKGGLWLENHLFAGQDDIQKTKEDLMEGAKSGLYDKEQVKELITICENKDYLPDNNPTFAEKLSRFKPLGLDPDNHSYVGTSVYKLAEHILEIDGIRYYVLFHPWSKRWLRFEKWEEINSSGLYPWYTSASHEDDKNFLSKSYGDDLYPVADAIIALFNQELTNREKRNYGARAFDKDVFTDVRKLDEAMHRPDGLVPADTKGGTRRISEALYEFKVGELSGTVNLIDWMTQVTGQQTGVTDMAQGVVADASKKASVSFLEQKSVSKRLSYGSQPYQAMLAELGKAYIYGLKDHMPAKMAIEVLGENGLEWDEITRLDLSTKKDVNVLIVSTDKQLQDNTLKKEERKNALLALAQSPNINPKWRDEQILRDVGGYDDVEVATALDVSTYGNKKSLAKASEAIQLIISNQKPQLWYGADTAFMQKIVDYAVDKKTSLKPEKFNMLQEYAMAHEQIAMANMERKANLVKQGMMQQQMGQPGAFPTQEATVPGQPEPAMPSQGLPAGVQGAMNKAAMV